MSLPPQGAGPVPGAGPTLGHGVPQRSPSCSSTSVDRTSSPSPPRRFLKTASSPDLCLTFAEQAEATCTWKSPRSFLQYGGVHTDAFISPRVAGTQRRQQTALLMSSDSSGSFDGVSAISGWKGAGSAQARQKQPRPVRNFRTSFVPFPPHEEEMTSSEKIGAASVSFEGARCQKARLTVPALKVFDNSDESEVEGGAVGGATQQSTDAVHQDLELRILMECLRLLGSQRELAAMRCAEFTKEIESDLTKAAAWNSSSSSSAAWNSSSSSRGIGGARGRVEVPSSADKSQGGTGAGSGMPQSSSPDEEQYWSSPSFYRGSNRRYVPVAGVPPSASLAAAGCRMPLDTYFVDSKKKKYKRAKKTPWRHTRHLMLVVEHSDSD